MMKYLLNSLILLIPFLTLAQTGSSGKVYGKITDDYSGEPVIFARVLLKVDGNGFGLFW